MVLASFIFNFSVMSLMIINIPFSNFFTFEDMHIRKYSVGYLKVRRMSV